MRGGEVKEVVERGTPTGPGRSSGGRRWRFAATQVGRGRGWVCGLWVLVRLEPGCDSFRLGVLLVRAGGALGLVWVR